LAAKPTKWPRSLEKRCRLKSDALHAHTILRNDAQVVLGGLDKASLLSINDTAMTLALKQLNSRAFQASIEAFNQRP